MRTLAEAKRELAQEIMKGTQCPCCGKHVKINKLSITKAMVSALAWITKHSDPSINGGWVRVQEIGPDWIKRSNSHAKLSHWGLLEGKEPDSTGNKGTGIYRPTYEGKAFLASAIRVIKYKFVYNGKVHGDGGPLVGVSDCYEKFDYDKMVRRSSRC